MNYNEHFRRRLHTLERTKQMENRDKHQAQYCEDNDCEQWSCRMYKDSMETMTDSQRRDLNFRIGNYD